MLPVLAYIHIRTNKGVIGSASFAGQRVQLKNFAKTECLEIQKWFSVTFETVERDFNAACELALKRGWPIIVVDKDRVLRDEDGYVDFLTEDGKVYDVKGFGADDALMRARIERAKSDRAKHSEATQIGQADAETAGRKSGNPHMERAWKSSVESRGTDADIHHRELERFRARAEIEGVTRYKDLAAWLNARGFPTARGRSWTPESVRSALERGKRRDPTLEELAEAHPEIFNPEWGPF